MTALKSTEEIRTMFNWRAVFAAFATSGLLLAPAAWAEPAIQSISSTQQAGGEVVRIELSEPLAAVPNGFAVQNPPRIAVDLPGVGNAMGRNNVEVNQGNLRSVSVAQAGERTRLVLNLKQATNYQAQIQGNALLLVLNSVSPQVAAAEQPVHFAPSQNVETLGIRGIDFRRGADGAGRVVVSLPSAQMGVDLRQQGQNLVVEFPRASLPDALRRRLDVTDFGTPVRMISTVQAGDRVRMVVEPTGAWEHSAYQTDEQFVLEVRPLKMDPNKLTQGPGYQGEKLSLNFQNIEVRALLQVIADFTNFNVVTSDTVTGTVTLRLKDVPWDQALDIIMQSKGLGVKKSGNVLWIAPKEELATKEQIDLEARKKVAELEPLRTQSFQLNYTKAEVVAKGLLGQNQGQGGTSGTSQTTRILSPRGSVIYETRTNQLFVSDIPGKLEEITQLIAKIDIPVRQVMIEARIVEADDTFGRALGVKLGATDMRSSFGDKGGVSIGGNYNAVGYQTGQVTDKIDFTNTQFVNLPANVSSSNFGGATSAPTFAVSLFNSGLTRFLNLELSALEADGKGKIVSSPRVITADQEKALIEQGEELPYQESTSSGATSISFRKASLKLEVTPQITPEGNVILDVDVNKDSVGRTTTAGFAIDTKHVKTKVLVENGGTVVIGGIYTQSDKNDVSKVPLLGDIPVLGVLFRSTTRTSSKTELLVFLTPKIVTDRAAVR
ncbi:type IV pilus secretin PilQ [Rubrivivax gelatinosus]|uniref:Type IV pilus biogenesis and competence protein PilQ n=1 Tax=Rubrivivax gelatinosus (strain NBRC 100245 / IL144) TaxID=983917 RepID=I0HMC6_RUBGI|nr:type IV pilus secretin PilQ [Rubrivivax gelatinosus]BAL94163.1 type IV pilus assembly protein PilQ [Rubrivivax gelatinosus IL144]